jgi:hypothetical protein
MARQKIEVEVDLPDGFESTGEYRFPTDGDWVSCGFGGDEHPCAVRWQTTGFAKGKYLILRRKEPLAIQACRSILKTQCCIAVGCDFLPEAHGLAAQAITAFERESK